MTIKSLRDLFEIGLRYAYDCEQQLVQKGLPGMIKGASSPELKTALEQHLEETRKHVTRLEQVFSTLGMKAETEDNDVVEEMIGAAEGMIDEIDASPLRDAALIVAGNQVEHYEMAMYGSLLAFAEQLDLGEVVTTLRTTLQEEKGADAKLTQIGESAVNPRAAGEELAA